MNSLGVERVLDAHLHVWSVPRPRRPYPWTPDPHPVEALLPVLNECSIDRAIQVTPTIMGYDNDYGVEIAGDHPARFGVFGRFDPTLPDIQRRLEAWMRRPGAEGIRLTFFGATAAPAGALVALDELWEACSTLTVPVAVLAPDALPELADVAERHPALRLVLDHLGLGVYEGSPGYFAGWRHLPHLAACPNVVAKISTLVEASVEPYPFRDVHEYLAEAVELFGVQRLIWGSNFPVVAKTCSYRESLSFLAECSFLDQLSLEWITHLGWEQFVTQQPQSRE